ncbi:hypothetical protein LINPERHAP1_LOCUS15632 [Linum perenne]
MPALGGFCSSLTHRLPSHS